MDTLPLLLWIRYNELETIYVSMDYYQDKDAHLITVSFEATAAIARTFTMIDLNRAL